MASANSLTVPVLNVVGGGLDQLVEQKCKQNIACCQNTNSEAVCVFLLFYSRSISNTSIERQPCRRRSSLRCSRFASLNQSISFAVNSGGGSHDCERGLPQGRVYNRSTYIPVHFNARASPSSFRLVETPTAFVAVFSLDEIVSFICFSFVAVPWDNGFMYLSHL